MPRCSRTSRWRPSLAPAIAITGGSASYTENAAAVTVDPTLVLSDADSANLYSAKVWISANFAAAEDALTWTNSANVTGSYAATGELRLTGTASVAEYQTVLRSVSTPARATIQVRRPARFPSRCATVRT